MGINKVNVLILDGKSEVRKELNGFFSEDEFLIHQASEVQEAYEILNENVIDIAVVDLNRQGDFRLNFIKKLKGRYPDVETVVIEDYLSERT